MESLQDGAGEVSAEELNCARVFCMSPDKNKEPFRQAISEQMTQRVNVSQ